MQRKLALKRLSASDLTIFEHHFRQTPGAKQKGINLDKAVIINKFFPGLQLRPDLRSDAMILSVYGPDCAELQTVTRKILKQQKNWRLNGEFIKAPQENKKRYNKLQKDDYAVMEFTGDMEPKAARVYLVARDAERDEEIHSAIDRAFGTKFSERRGMIEISADELAEVLSSIDLSQDHPILDFTDADLLEDTVLGGVEGSTKLLRRRRSRGVTQEELAKARQNAAQVGRQGEELIYDWLEQEKLAGKIIGYNWDSDSNAIAPYDFTLTDKSGKVTRKIDVKSTAGGFNNPIHISCAELVEISSSDVPYDIYRLYAVSESMACMRIAKDVKSFVEPILNCLNLLPEGVRADGVSVSPDRLTFDPEIRLDFRDEELDE